MILTILQQDIDKAIAWEKGNRWIPWSQSCPIANAANRQFKAQDAWLAYRNVSILLENGELICFTTDEVGARVERLANDGSQSVTPCDIELTPEVSNA